MSKISFLIALGIIVGAIIWYVIAPPRESGSKPRVISSFEECLAAGNPVMPVRTADVVQSGGESRPRQCQTPDGKHFVEGIQAPAPPAPLDIPSVPGI